MGFRLENNEVQKIVILPSDLRWAMYYRLRELDIPCSCGAGQPLQVEADGVVAAIQIWSVGRSHLGKLPTLRKWLEGCLTL